MYVSDHFMQVRRNLTALAHQEALKVFARNVKSLFLARPLLVKVKAWC